MFSLPQGFFKNIVKRKDCCAKLYFCNIYKNMLVRYVVCKNITILFTTKIYTISNTVCLLT